MLVEKVEKIAAKGYPKRYPKNDAEKVSKNDAKMTKKEAKMDAKIMIFQVFWENVIFRKSSFSLRDY